MREVSEAELAVHVQTHAENLAEQGYSIMEGAVSEDFQAEIRAELARLEQDAVRNRYLSDVV